MSNRVHLGPALVSRSPRRRWLSGAMSLGAALAMLACGSDSSGGGSNIDGGGAEPDAMIPEDVPDRLTYISQLTIPAVSSGVAVCCFDFGERSENGVGKIDNAFAVLANSIKSFPNADFQVILDQNLQSGGQVILFNHVGLSGETDSFRLDGLSGAFAGSTTYTEASAGTGTFTVDPGSYDSNGDALINIPSDLVGSALAAGPDDFLLSIPLGTITIALTVREARLTGAATLSPTAVSYTGGELSGFLLIDEIFEALNAYIASECSCLGLDGDLFVKAGDEWNGDNCVDDTAGLCAEAPNCNNIGGGLICPLLPAFIKGDIDTNDDASVYEAMSVGFQWTGANATLAP